MGLPKIEISEAWEDYELIDSGNGRRLERFGEYVLDRPDPGVIWERGLPDDEWQKASAYFERTIGEKGKWIQNISIPEKWLIHYKNLAFWVKLSPFKHTGIFPEQASQWDFIGKNIKEAKKEVSVLNLFAYTGGASMAAASAGAKVTHVDASRPAITWANENREASGMGEAPVRWILDDALEFTEREIKRGNKYDAIIMDPPVYGHGPKGTIWDFSKDFPKLLKNCKQLLSDNPLFVLVNAYAVSISSVSLANALANELKDFKGETTNGELALKDRSGRFLTTGIWALFSA